MSSSRMDESEAGEASCPFCNMPIRSDANAPAFCGLCGMGIHDIEDAPGILREDGKVILFCCSDCLSMYERSCDL